MNKKRWKLKVFSFSLVGHLEAVVFLTEKCKMNPHLKDR